MSWNGCLRPKLERTSGALWDSGKPARSVSLHAVVYRRSASFWAAIENGVSLGIQLG